jgi:NADH-quinone oxidoreductase subunit N
MNSLSYLDFFHIAFAQVVLVAVALILLALDLALGKSALSYRRQIAFPAAIAVCLSAIVHLAQTSGQTTLLDGVLISSPPIRLVQIVLLTLTILILLLSIDASFTPHLGEYVLLLLFATVGMMFLVATQDLLVLFVSLELLSLCLYLLTGFDKPNPRSTEAALKYFLFGAISAAFLLFGFSLLYGLSGSTLLPAIGHAGAATPLNPLAILAIVFTVIGLGFKVAAAPFHFWAPDVYQGAPAPVAAFIASSSKVASFFVFFLFMAIGFHGAEGQLSLHASQSGWIPVLAIVAALSMLLGNLTALVQTSLRRLLAYSAVAHAGYMLLAFLAHTPESLAALLFYVSTYALTTIGIFAILQALEVSTQQDSLEDPSPSGPKARPIPAWAKGPGTDQTQARALKARPIDPLPADRGNAFNLAPAAHNFGLAGLSRRSPFLAASLAILLLSLAGIPPLSGFFAKFYLFTAVLAAAPASHLYLTLIILAIAMSAVSLYYYLRVLKSAYIAEAPEPTQSIPIPVTTTFTIALITAATVLLGCAPNLFLQWITTALHAITT